MKIKFYNHFPQDESELWEDEENYWVWVFDLLPYVRNVHDSIFGKSISIGWLFWSIKFMFEPSLNECVNENKMESNDGGEKQ